VAGGVDPTSPKVVRAAAGASFAIDVIDGPGPTDAIAHLRSAGYRIATAVVNGGEAHVRADLSAPLAIVLGSEAHGASDEVVDGSDLLVSIEMAGPTESLNVAMAGTLLCFEVLRRASPR
jgi:TrmH family RNA methyltransferase